MLSEQSLRDGNLGAALIQLQDQVRKDPSQAKYRVFLFQLLAVLGQWERALNQLNVVAEMDAATLPMVQTYREALRCEVLRTSVFSGQRSPLVFGDPPQWVALLLEALHLIAEGQYRQAQPVRERAFEEAPSVSGSINGQPFEWIADADVRIGPVLEAIINGRYYWIPFHRMHTIQIEQPVDLRDIVWMPAQFTWANGGQTVGLIPTRYPGSEASEDSMIQLARKTEWLEHEGETYLGLGQRLLATDAGEYSLMDIRQIALNALDTAPNTSETADG